MSKNIIDLTGMVFGRLFVLYREGSDKLKNCVWKCKCACGKIKYVDSISLRKKFTKSCGCLKKENSGRRCKNYSDKNFYNSYIEERLMAHSEKFHECRLWTGKSKDSFGYGYLSIKGKRTKAHRASYELWKGEIPKGLFVCHSCDNPNCINPDHLFLGNAKDNCDDMMNKKRNFTPKGEKANSKLLEKDVIEIRKIYKEKTMTILQICKKFNVTTGCIKPIIYERTWKHLL